MSFKKTNKCPELPPDEVKEMIVTMEDKDKLEKNKPKNPEPAPEEPESDDSIEQIDMRI